MCLTGEFFLSPEEMEAYDKANEPKEIKPMTIEKLRGLIKKAEDLNQRIGLQSHMQAVSPSERTANHLNDLRAQLKEIDDIIIKD